MAVQRFWCLGARDGNNNAGEVVQTTQGQETQPRRSPLGLCCCPPLSFKRRKRSSAPPARQPTPILQVAAISPKHINKIDENGDIISHKSEVASSASGREVGKSPTGSTASLVAPPSAASLSQRSRSNGSTTLVSPAQNHVQYQHHSSPTPSQTQLASNNASPTLNHVQHNSNHVSSPINHMQRGSSNASPVMNHSNDASPTQMQNNYVTPPSNNTPKSFTNISPSRIIQEPPTIEDDFDDDPRIVILPSPRSRRSKSPSVHEERFINNTQETDDVVVEDTNEICGNEERFINLKDDSPSKDITDRASVTSAKFSYKENLPRSSAHSTKSEEVTSSPQNGRFTPVRNIIASAPPISYFGSSVSTEEEVKSVESAFSDVSLKDSIKSLSSEENEKVNDDKLEHSAGAVSKVSPSSKSKKSAKVLTKALSGKFSKNKVQPMSAANFLKPFERPKEALARSLAQIDNPDWETVMTGLQSMECLVKHHSVYLESHLTPVARAIACQVKNLRSQVARAACRLAGNLFTAQKKCIESEAEELAVPLLSRTADTNKFLRSDANEALDKMCDSINAQKSISILLTRGAVHQNAIVRGTSARLLGTIAKTSGPEKIFSIQKDIRDKLFQSGADLLTEGSLETRGHAKQLFKVLSQNPQFLKTLREIIPLSKYRNIEKALNNIRTQ